MCKPVDGSVAAALVDAEMTGQLVAYDVFNGDADGICALHQLRMAQPLDAQLITGVKRDIALGRRVPDGVALDVTMLDISFDKNADDVRRVLEAGGWVRYVDHHAAFLLFAHPRLEALLDMDERLCTSLLVDRYLNGRYRDWAIVGAFGDNLGGVARTLAAARGYDTQQTEAMARLGMLLNYNAYGESVDDLHVSPAKLYQSVHRFESPFAFMAEAQEFPFLDQGYEADRCHLREVVPHWQNRLGAVYVLPCEAWARRLSGSLANQLAVQDPDRSFAVLTRRAEGGYLVSVRTSTSCIAGAQALCSQYPSGGGRRSAAGIDHLPEAELPRFLSHYSQHIEGAR